MEPASVVLSLIGIVGSYFVGRHLQASSSPKPELSWHTTEFAPAQVNTQISHRTKLSIDGVDVTKPKVHGVKIWNSGNTTLRDQDVTNIDPIRIELDGMKLLGLHVDTVSNPASGASAFLRNNAVHISFDYLDPNDGLKLYILTDLESEGRGAYCSGAIKGNGKLHNAALRKAVQPTSLLENLVAGAVLLLIIVWQIWTGYMFVRYFTASDAQTNAAWFALAFLVFPIFVAGVIAISLVSERRRGVRPLPSKLDYKKVFVPPIAK